jgi:hypothetical protein
VKKGKKEGRENRRKEGRKVRDEGAVVFAKDGEEFFLDCAVQWIVKALR